MMFKGDLFSMDDLDEALESSLREVMRKIKRGEKYHAEEALQSLSLFKIYLTLERIERDLE